MAKAYPTSYMLAGPPVGQKSYRIPIDANEDVLVTFPSEVTPDGWDTFMTILEAMKGPILRTRSPEDE